MNKCSHCGCEIEGNVCIACGTKPIIDRDRDLTSQPFSHSKDLKKDRLKKLLKWSLCSFELFIILSSAFFFLALNAGLEALNSPVTAVLPLIFVVYLNIGLIILCKCAFDWDKDKFDKRMLHVAATILITAIIMIPIIRVINMSLRSI